MSVKAKTEDIEAFVAVVDAGNFSRAAELLGQQVAKVSRAVARLEGVLNVTLLNRTTRRLELTEEGVVYLHYARDSVNLLEKGEEALRLLSQKPSGLLRVDAASPFVLHQLTPLIGEFREAYPEIKLDITSHDNIIDLLEHKTDIAIRIGALSDSNLHAKTLGRSALHLVASPAYLASSNIDVTVTSLGEHRLIGFSSGASLNRWPLSEEVKLNFDLKASSGETIRQLCLASQGIALLSNFMVADDLENGKLISVLGEHLLTPNNREPVQAVYYRNSAVSSRISAFLDFIQPRLKL